MKLTKHTDIQSIHQRETIQLREDPPVELEIQALPPDFDAQLEEELPPPSPKRLGVEKDAQGRVLFDDAGNPVPKYNTDDPAYQKAMKRTRRLQAVMTVIEGVAPGQWSFSATKDADPAAYYEAVLAEMKDFGISMGDMVRLIQAIGSISEMSEDDLKVAEGVFSEAES